MAQTFSEPITPGLGRVLVTGEVFVIENREGELVRFHRDSLGDVLRALRRVATRLDDAGADK